MYEKHDSYFPTIRCKDLFGAHIAMKLLWKKASDLIAYENWPQDAFLVLIIFPFPWKDCCRKRAFYTCVMKWFQPVCISVGETNKDNYCQQIPFYPPCCLCLGRPGTLQPESIGLLGQSALAFYVFLYIPHSSRSPVLITPRASVMAVACRTKLHIPAMHLGRQGCVGENRDCSSGRTQLHINVCKFPHSCWLRLEKLISWMQRQYWCHQAERSGALLTSLCLREEKITL